MKIITALEQLHSLDVPCVVALGTFDGLHLGHKDVIAKAKEYAASTGEKLAVFTFSNHPLALIRPQDVPAALITQEEKHAYLKDLGVDLLIDIPFEHKLACLSPQEFLAKLEAVNLNCRVVGENFTFVCKGVGNIKTLQTYADEKNIKLIVRTLVSDNGTVISSTAIRQLIANGEVEQAGHMLGRAYALTGKVTFGNRRGNLIGFPTANLELYGSKAAVPASGVYAVKVLFDGATYCGMANIGNNPTFGDVQHVRLEVNIFDFNKDIYDKQITVSFYGRIRGEVKFNDVKQLAKQLAEDKKAVNNFLAQHNNFM